MGETTRFGVSLDESLLEQFDALCQRRGYASRSEALRDVIRETLAADALPEPQAESSGVLTLVYDHHIRDLSKKLTERQHEDHDCVVATLHVHLDHHNCLEVLILKGQGSRIRAMAEALRAMRGVKHGTFSFTPSGRCAE